MPSNAKSPTGTTPEPAGGATGNTSSLHRGLRWRPRTTRAKALAAAPTAAVAAGASLVKTPVQARYATTPVLAYTSYTQFASDITSGAITYPYKWVMYDPENWDATPASEQQDPVRYMTLFGQLAHANGLKVIQAPALDLAYVPGTVLPRQPGETADQWFLRVNIAGKAAATADIFQLQDESNTTSGGQYSYMFNTAAAQAQTANPSIRVFSEVSTAQRHRSPDGLRSPVHQPRRLLRRRRRQHPPDRPVLPAHENRRLLNQPPRTARSRRAPRAACRIMVQVGSFPCLGVGSMMLL